jgi:F420-dependent oxidoreductase-like protein
MSISFGVHIGPQNIRMDDLRALWRRLDERGVDWISLWDHFYETTPPAGGDLSKFGSLDHFETLTALGALAADTKRARLGVLVLYVGYRTPGVLAKAAATLDHLSGGRFELGLGAGWHEWESHAYGYPFPPIGTRLDMLEEATQIIRGMLTQERTTFSGEHFWVENASCLPRPVQSRLPIIIGGLGEKRTLRIAARHGDGWNAAYVSPEQFRHLGKTLDEWCEKEGRDPASISRTVNLVWNVAPDQASLPRLRKELVEQWGFALQRVEGGVLAGTPADAADRIAEYVAAGASGVNVALRAPWSAEALDGYVEETLPALRREFGAKAASA